MTEFAEAVTDFLEWIEDAIGLMELFMWFPADVIFLGA